MFKRILVPLDGSDLAEKILPKAKELADKYQAELILLRVFEPEQALASPVSSFDTYHLVVSVKEAKVRARKYLEELKKGLKLIHTDLPIDIISVESSGTVGKTIAEQAIINNIDLIAMTSHGYTGFRRFVMGSVTTETLKHATCPALVVPAEYLDV